MEAGVGMGEGKSKEKREVSRILSLFIFLFIPVSETVKARSWCVVSGHKAESASWQRRWRFPGWQGCRTTACNPDCSPCNKGLHAKPDGPEKTHTLQQTHYPTGTSCPAPGSVGDQLAQLCCSDHFCLNQARLIPSHSPGQWEDLGDVVRTLPLPSLGPLTHFHRALEPCCICTKKPLTLENKLSCVFLFST